MKLLEYYQNQHYLNEYFVYRKTQIPPLGDINLYGVRGSGKSTLIFDFLQEVDEEVKLYIDMDDPNLTFNPINTLQLQRYIDSMGITHLVLDHYIEGVLENFPNVERLFIISRLKLKKSGFTFLELFPLDYEEFLAFESAATETTTFNHFLKTGTLPVMAKRHRANVIGMKQFLKSNFSENETKLLLILAEHHTKHLTTHQIYLYAKEHFKVSKDWLYKTIKNFSKEKILFFINDCYQKSGKKLIFFDFAFAKYLTTGQPFIVQFDAMVVLSLVKHRIAFKALGIHGYLTHQDELIIPAPFESEESLWVKSQNKFAIFKEYNIQKVTIVTVANQYEFNIQNIYFEALPFYEWTVLDDATSLEENSHD